MWLIKKGVMEAVQRARAQGTAPPPGAIEAFERRFAEAAASGEPRIFKRAGDVAEILIKGVLTSEPDWYAHYYGGGNTTYPEIIQSLALAGADSSIRRVVLNVCSPGGYVGGLFDTLAALEAFTKPKETFAAQADSAAYAIAALGGKITASNPAAEFGSVGVCATYVQYDFEKIYDITSSNAPNKRPDPSTEEGQAVIRKYLDAIEELFVDAIAKGRGTTTDYVTTNFGRGEVMLAGSAKKLGMIDKIAKAAVRSAAVTVLPDSESGSEPAEAASDAPPPQVSAPAVAPVAAAAQATQQPSSDSAAVAPPAPKPDASAASGGAPTKAKKMDEAQLQAQHPELYSAVFNKGKAEAEKTAAEAAATEKDRVEAHLTAGQESGDMKTAVESILAGVKMTSKLLTTYMMAGMRKGAVGARAADDDVAAAATEGASPGKDQPAKTKAEQVADAIERQTKGDAA